jgi:hypothetical protein
MSQSPVLLPRGFQKPPSHFSLSLGREPTQAVFFPRFLSCPRLGGFGSQLPVALSGSEKDGSRHRSSPKREKQGVAGAAEGEPPLEITVATVVAERYIKVRKFGTLFSLPFDHRLRRDSAELAVPSVLVG